MEVILLATYFKDSKEKREFIIDRKYNLSNEGVVDNFNYENQSKSGVCNDKSRVTIKATKKEIKEIKHKSNACVITTACIDLLCEKITGMSIKNTKEFL